MEPKTNHPALTQLQALIDRAPADIRDHESGKIWAIDPQTVRRAAVLILFGVLDDEPATTCPDGSPVGTDLDVLILVRAGSMRHHAGEPAFPGGKIDPEDHDRAATQGISVQAYAALREAREETGLDTDGVRVLGQLPEVPLPVSNFMVTPVIGWWDSPTSVTAVDANESTLVLRVPVADLLNPEHRRTARVHRGRLTHKSPAFHVHGEHGTFTIWGFTGILLSRIFEELGWAQDWDRTHYWDVEG